MMVRLLEKVREALRAEIRHTLREEEESRLAARKRAADDAQERYWLLLGAVSMYEGTTGKPAHPVILARLSRYHAVMVHRRREVAELERSVA